MRGKLVLLLSMIFLIWIINTNIVIAEEVITTPTFNLGQTGGEFSYTTSESFVSSTPQVTRPGIVVRRFTGAFDERAFTSEEYREICRERQDFLIQIMPGGCTPNVVRSDLLAEQNVPVFCQLQAIQINPAVEASRIRNIRLTPVGIRDVNVAGIAYHRPKIHLSNIQNSEGFASIDNIGYAVIILKQNPNEAQLPENVTGSLQARIDYDVPYGFGFGLQDKPLPILTDKEWQQRYQEFEFMDGKGFIRLESMEGAKAKIGIYTDANNRYDSFILEEGKDSGERYLPGFQCNAAYKMSFPKAEAPDLIAKIELNNDEYEVHKNTRFGESLNCQVSSIEYKYAGAGIVKVRCNGKSITLELKQKDVLLDVDKNPTHVSVSEEIENMDGIYLGYVGLKPEVFVVLFKGDYKVEKDAIESFGKSIEKSREYKSRENYFVIKQSDVDGINVNGVNVKFRDFAVVQKDIEENEAYDEFIDAYQEYLGIERDYNGNVKDTSNYILAEGKSYGQEALEKALALATDIDDSAKKLEIVEMLRENYGEVGEASFLSTFDTTKSGASFEVDGSVNYIRLVGIEKPSFEEKGVVIKFDNSEKSLANEGEYILSGSENGETIILKKIDFDEIEVEGKCLVDGKLQSGKRETIALGHIEYVCNRPISVKEINLQKLARLKVTPINKHIASVVNFSYGVGVEKRGIELSPEKAMSRINKLNENIVKWESINEKLGKTVETMKAACFATSAVLQVKNFVTGMGGKALAREEAMRYWHEWCDNNIELYDGSKDRCFRENSNKIEDDVDFYTNIIEQVNSAVKPIDEANINKGSGLFGGRVVNTNVAKEQFLNEKLSRLDVSGVEFIDPSDPNGEKKIAFSDVLEDLKAESASYDQLVEMYKAGLILKSSELTNDQKDRLQKRYYSLFNQVNENKAADEVRSLQDEINAQPGIMGNVFIEPLRSEKTLSQYYEGTTISSGGLGFTDFRAIDEDESKKESNLPFKIVPYKGKTYFIVLRDTNGREFTSKRFYEFDPVAKKVRDEITTDMIPNELKNVIFIKRDASSYRNNYLNPVVRYHEIEPMKGMAAIVPIDIANGWYAATSNTLGLFGNVEAYRDSGQIQSFWVCNVGSNGREEFDGNADDCMLFNIFTGQSLTILPGLASNDAERLISKARDCLQDASSGYKSEIVHVKTSCGDYQVGNPAPSIPGSNCADFMPASDCQILFNVCDPVICPSSRCNLGGKFNVNDVVQTGIVGGVFMCLPNIKEGIVVPLCLTGIHAGIDNWVSIMKAHRDCLQENLATGAYVGICDEISAIYKCEFFWRQISPISKILLPRLLEKIHGQGIRGGGEYMSVMGSWERTQDSINFFKNNYAVNALRAFRIRSQDEAGSEVCKGFISIKYPKEFKTLIEPDSPPQFAAWFDEIPQTTATVTPRSHYKVFFHIFAGNDQGIHYSVYLKDAPGTSFYQDGGRYVVATGFVGRGGYVSESPDFIGPAGFKQLCVLVNAQEKCGFQKVTTDFAINYLADMYIENQAANTKIDSERECISGTPDLMPLINPNLQAGVEEALEPAIYNRGIIRVCSTKNPGLGTNIERWQKVGNCGNSEITCWLDKHSISDAITAGHKGAIDKTLDALDKAALTDPEGNELKALEKAEEISWFTELNKEVKEFIERSNAISVNEKTDEFKLEVFNFIKTDIENKMAEYDILTTEQEAFLYFMKAYALDAVARGEYNSAPKSQIIEAKQEETVEGEEAKGENGEKEEDGEGAGIFDCSNMNENEELSVRFASCISEAKINNILQTSPAKNTGKYFIELGEEYNIDPIIALAFFKHESSFGTRGIAKSTKSIGNIKYTSSCPGQEFREYCAYESWEQGIEHWYKLTSGETYVGSGLNTIEKIIPKYAPASDGNDVNAYIADIRNSVESWRA